jgi:hypothetical protein
MEGTGVNPMVNYDDGTLVTLGELKDAAQRIVSDTVYYKHDADIVRDGSHANSLAVNLVRDVIKYREPIWEPGDVVEDATGAWFRHSNTRDGWTTFEGMYLTDSRLKRPLIQRGHDNRYRG